MHVTISSFDVNEENIDKDIALRCFEHLVLPVMQKQPGYQGTVVLRTPEGRGMVLAMWDSEDSARESATNGHGAQMNKLNQILEDPSPDKRYAVVLTDAAPHAGASREEIATR